MKTRIFILSSLLCMCGALNAMASECTGAGCDIEPLTFEEFEWVMPSDDAPTAIVVARPTPVVQMPTWMESDPDAAVMPMAQNLPMPVRNIDVKLLISYAPCLSE